MALITPGFDFASRDYENIRRELLKRASLVAPEWTDRDPSDFGVLLIDLWAYMGDVLHYYIDRAAGEAFITTATQRESLLALANLFDYVPFSRKAATATIVLSNTLEENYVLPAGTVFVGTSELGNLTFFSTEENTLISGQTTTIFVTEGSIVEEEVLTNSASGVTGQRYNLSKLNAVSTSVQILVYEDGVTPTPWNLVTDISLVDTNSRAYSTNVTAENETQVLFGNFLSGKVPPTNSKITATYYTTSGSEGNIPQNRITSFRNFQPLGISVISSSAATGGSSGESIDSIKTSLKATIRSQDRAVTINDFVDLALRITGIYNATVSYTPSISGGGSVTIYGIPYISDYPSYTPSVVPISSGVQEEIVRSIQPLAMLGVTVISATSVTLIPKSIQATIFVEESYIANSVKKAVEDALNFMFELGILKFGEDIRLGDIYKTIHDIEGVLYANVTLSGASPSPIQLIKKGSFDLTTSGGITTSV